VTEEEQRKAQIERIEREKANLRNHRTFAKPMSYDEAVFEAAKYRLKEALSEVANLPDIPENLDLFRKYQAFCMDQIRAIVDVALCHLLIRPVGTLEQRPGRRSRVISRDHNALVPRAKWLVQRLDGNLSGKTFKTRYRSILITTEDVMNTTNWQALARAFYRTYTRSTVN